MSNFTDTSPRILRRKEVETRTGLSRSTIYLHINKGLFPAPVSLGPRAVGWYESDINQWIADRKKTGSKKNRAQGIKKFVK